MKKLFWVPTEASHSKDIVQMTEIYDSPEVRIIFDFDSNTLYIVKEENSPILIWHKAKLEKE